ncbi:MAG: flagellin [Brevundimonas sp.]|uniref:flagellin n=1 Tax=Brevundimonas sp. TaxID=1871086 RepID=UPI00391A19BB
MTRVSTMGNYQSALLNLMTAQVRGLDAQKRVSTEKVAHDFAGYGRASETLTALKSAQSRIQGFIETGQAVAGRMKTQALAFDRIAEGASGARQTIAEGLAAGRVDGLMQELQSYFQISQEGLNAKHQGRHLFAGGDTETAPVTVSSLAQLAAAPDVASVFVNDRLATVSRLDENATLQTGFLADDVGAELFQIFRDIQEYHTGPDGPVDGLLTDQTRDFLTIQLGRFRDAHSRITDVAARSGSMQARVDSLLTSHDNQKLTLQQLIGDRTDANMAEALTDLEMSQISIQASAQVISQLQSTSLLNLLRF